MYRTVYRTFDIVVFFQQNGIPCAIDGIWVQKGGRFHVLSSLIAILLYPNQTAQEGDTYFLSIALPRQSVR